MQPASFIFDLVCLAIIVGTAAWYGHKGFLVGLVSFFGTLASLVLAFLAARFLSPWLFDTLFRKGLEQSMAETLAAQSAGNINELLHNMLGFLPDELINSLAGQLDASLNFAAPDIAEQVVTGVVQPLVVPFIAIVAFFVLFILLRLLFGLLRRLAMGVGSLPVISVFNKAFGAFMGVFVGALYVYLLLCAVWAWDTVSPQNGPGVLYFSKSVFYRLLYNLNFFAA